MLNLPVGTNCVFVPIVLATDNLSEAWAIDDVAVSVTPETSGFGLLGIAGFLELRRRRAGR